jgi:hypothetical protein
MSAVTQEPVTSPAPVTGLLRSEVRRFRSRRFIQVLLALSVVGWLAGLAIGLLNFGVPTPAELASAQQAVEENVRLSNEGRQQCLDDPSRPDDVSADEWCGPPITEDDIPLEAFLERAPFSFVDTAQDGALGFAVAAAVLCFLVGATWIGAEWSTRSIVALLFWEPRRGRLMGAKIGVVIGACALVGAAAQAAWLAMAGILSLAAGDGAAVPPGFWGDLLATQGRGVLLTVLIGLLGFGLTHLVHNTGAALGIAFVYVAIVETAIRVLKPEWQPWLLTNNAGGLVQEGGLTVIFWNSETLAPDGSFVPVEYLIGNLQAGIFLSAVCAVIIAAGVVLFARSDVH